METFSALLAICAGNSSVSGEFPAQRPVTRSFDIFFDLRLNKRKNKQSWGWWFETLSCPLWRQCNMVNYHIRLRIYRLTGIPHFDLGTIDRIWLINKVRLINIWCYQRCYMVRDYVTFVIKSRCIIVIQSLKHRYRAPRFCQLFGYILKTHWGRVTYVCVSKQTIIGSDNRLSPGRRQAIIWNNAGILLIRTIGTNLSEILSEINKFSFRKIHFKMLCGEWRSLCLDLNVLSLCRCRKTSYYRSSDNRRFYYIGAVKMARFLAGLGLIRARRLSTAKTNHVPKRFRMS